MTTPDVPSGVIVALPAVTAEIPHAPDPEHALHVTLAYIEHPNPGQLEQIGSLVAAVAAETAPFTVKVNGRGRLGDDDAAVLLVESAALAALHDTIAADPNIPPDKFPTWTPHLTIGWGADFPIESVDPGTLPEVVPFDRVALWHGDTRLEFHLTGEDTPALLSAAGVSIPEINDESDLPVAVAYATANPAARWYVTKRAAALGMSATLPEWSAPGPDPAADHDLQLLGPGGVQAAAQVYIRMCSYGQHPDAADYQQITTGALRHRLLDDPVVIAASAWQKWVTAR